LLIFITSFSNKKARHPFGGLHPFFFAISFCPRRKKFSPNLGAGLLTRASSYSAAFPAILGQWLFCLSSALTAPGEWLIIRLWRTTALPY